MDINKVKDNLRKERIKQKRGIMNNGRLEFDYTELKEALIDAKEGGCGHSYNVGYQHCMDMAEQFFLDKLKLKVVK
jgi:hypothetical protein